MPPSAAEGPGESESRLAALLWQLEDTVSDVRSEVERELAESQESLEESRRETASLTSRLEALEADAQALEQERAEHTRLTEETAHLRSEVERLNGELEQQRAAEQQRVDALAEFRAKLAEEREQWSQIEALLDDLANPQSPIRAVGPSDGAAAPAEELPPPRPPAPDEPTMSQETPADGTRVANPTLESPSPAPEFGVTAVSATVPPPPPPEPPPVTEPPPALEALAQADLDEGQLSMARPALERLPARLEADEWPARLAIAEYGGRDTLLALTDRRLLVLKLDEAQYQAVPYALVTSAEVKTGRFGRNAAYFGTSMGEVVVKSRRQDILDGIAAFVRERVGEAAAAGG